MHSWLTRCTIGLSCLAVAGSGLLAAAPAQAAGTDIVVSRPGAPASEAATTAPVSKEVEVEQTPVEVEPAANGTPEPERHDVEPFRMAGVTWDADSDARDVTVRVQVREGGRWTAWQQLDVESVTEGGRPGTAPLWTGSPADAIAVEVKAASGTPEGVKVTTIDPGKAEVVTPVRTAAFDPTEDESVTEEIGADGTPSVVPMPSIITRSQWKAGAGTSCSAPVTRPKALGVVMHHTAGSNTYTKAESAGIVRSYQTYHVKGQGWCDIGYNFLVDRFGQIFEGRKGGMTNQVRAAHSGVDAVNQYATGVSMMGHFDYVRPSAAMQSAVVKLVGWRLKYFGANPKGTYSAGGRTYKVINGHRDVKSTACPGKYGYAWLNESGGLRDRVATYVSKASKAAGAPSAAPKYTAPTNVKTSVRPTSVNVSWKAVSKAPGYRILISPTGSTKDALYYRTSGASNTSITIPNLHARRDYRVRVAVYDAATKKVLGPWTAAPGASARTPAFQPVSGVKAAARGLQAINVTWAAQAGAPGYRVQITPAEGGRNRYVTTYTNSAMITGLTKGTRYRVRVAVVYPSTSERVSGYTRTPYPVLTTKGITGTPSAGASLAAPTGVKTSVRPTSINVSWKAVKKAPGYRILVTPAGSTTGVYYRTSGATSITIPNLVARRTYTIRIAAYDPVAKKQVGAWTPSAVSARTPAFSPVSGVRAGATGLQALNVTWTAQAGAPGYRVQVTPAAGGKSRYLAAASNSVMVTGLTKGTKYRVRVAVVYPASGERVSGYTGAPYPVLSTKGAATSAPAPKPSAKNTVTPSSGAVTFKGHGYGHGIGMSQYGAEGGARAGKKYNQILAKYYPGTKLSSKSATIRVLLSGDTSNSVRVKPKSGLKLRKLANNAVSTLPTKVSGRAVSDWSIDLAKADARKNTLFYRSGSTWYAYTTFSGDAQFEGPTSISLVMPSGATQAFRGALRSARHSSTKRDTVNVLSLEDYTRGVVAREMPSSWSLEALKAQSVAARTYGSRFLGSSKHYDICDTTACQVYGGVSAETSRTNQAIDGTRGKILTYGGTPAFTQFSSSSGGYTNAGSMPYLKAVSDPWDNWSGNKMHAWTQKVSASTIQSKYSIGTLRSITITRRNGHGDQGGRVLSLTLKGSKASKTITGVDARWAFGLKSDWFGF